MNHAARKIRLIMELRGQGVADTRVLSAIERVPREAFVPATFADQAYENTALPIGRGQTISQPLIVGLMTQALQLDDRHKVLEIGTGSGYQTAILAHLCRRVYTVERYRNLLKEAEARIDALKIRNVTAQVADGTLGWRQQAPFDRILVTAAATSFPVALGEQLGEGGIMVLPVGSGPIDQYVCRITRRGDTYEEERLWPVRFVPLVGGLPERGDPQ